MTMYRASMSGRGSAMLSLKWGLWGCLLVMLTVPIHAKSLYYIMDKRGGTDTNIKEIRINEMGILAYEEVGPRVNMERLGEGAVGLAMDTWEGYLFVTHQGSNELQLVNARTMKALPNYRVSGAASLDGIVFEHSKNRLYVIDRGTSQLYVLNWNAQWEQLTPEAGSPFHLADVKGYGLALDEQRSELYVVSMDPIVRVFSTYDLREIKTIELSRRAVSVEIDPKNQLLYTGAGLLDDYTLLQYDLSTGTERLLEISDRKGVIGMAIDYENDWVYLTTGSSYGGENGILALDKTLERQNWSPVGRWPTDLVISGTTGFNPFTLENMIVDGTGIVEGDHFAHPGDVIIYEIRFANTYSTIPIANVTVQNLIPAHLIYLKAEAVEGELGTYLSDTRSYIVRVPELGPGVSRAYRLVCQLAHDVPPNTLIRQPATISALGMMPTTLSADLTAIQEFRPLNISKRIIAGAEDVNGVFYAKPGAEITYEIVVDNKTNPWSVSGISVVDELPRELQYLGIEGLDDANAVYQPNGPYLSFSLAQLDSGMERRMRFNVRVPDNILPGTPVLNRVRVESEQTGASETEHAMVVIAADQPLDLSLTLLGGSPSGTPLQVEPGQILNYEITITNRDNLVSVDDVVVGIEFSPGLTLLGADPDNGIGSEQTYSWTYATLVPGASVGAILQLKVDSGLPGGSLLETDVRVFVGPIPVAGSTQVVQTRLYPMAQAVTAFIPRKMQVVDPNTVGYILPGEEFHYRIQVSNPQDTAPIHNVKVKSQLPHDVVVLVTEPNNIYNPITHSVDVNYPVLAQAQGAMVDIKVRARDDLPPGVVFQNQVLISSDEMGLSESIITSRVCMEVVNTRVGYDASLPTNKIGVVMVMPPHIVDPNQIDSERAFVLYPGQVSNVLDPAPLIWEVQNRVKLQIGFDPLRVRQVIGDPGAIDVVVEGWLDNGQCFSGSGRISFPY